MNKTSDAERKGDEPAYPWRASYGLTKREAFAMAAMQALISAQPDRRYDAISDEAVLHAESLLNRLCLNQEPRT